MEEVLLLVGTRPEAVKAAPSRCASPSTATEAVLAS
jgi:hypothetical protein